MDKRKQTSQLNLNDVLGFSQKADSDLSFLNNILNPMQQNTYPNSPMDPMMGIKPSVGSNLPPPIKSLDKASKIRQTQEQLQQEEPLMPEPSFEDEEMKQALEDQKRNMGLALLMEGAQQIGAGIAGTKVDPDYAKSFKEMSKLPVESIKELRKSTKEKIELDQEKDLNSARSKSSEVARKTAKDMLTKIGYKSLADKITDNMSAAQIKTLLGGVNIQNLMSQYEALQNRLEISRQRDANKKDAAKSALDEKNENYITKERSKLKETKEAKDLLSVETAMNNLEASLKLNTSAADIGAVYKFMKALDSDSAVREAEIELAQSGQGHLAKLRVELSKYGNRPRILEPKYISQMLDYIKAIKAATQKRYKKVASPVLKQAKARGIEEDRLNEIDPTFGIIEDQPITDWEDVNK